MKTAEIKPPISQSNAGVFQQFPHRHPSAPSAIPKRPPNRSSGRCDVGQASRLTSTKLAVHPAADVSPWAWKALGCLHRVENPRRAGLLRYCEGWWW
jgi:hypothetical protein